MPDLPKHPKPHSTPAVRHAWAAERGGARVARATGDADVSALAPMDVPDDLRALLAGSPVVLS